MKCGCLLDSTALPALWRNIWWADTSKETLGCKSDVDDRDLKYSDTKLDTTVPSSYWSLLCTSDMSDMFTFLTDRYVMASSLESLRSKQQIYETLVNFHQ